MQAQQLLKRVEERDLYSCTANIRIPEIKLESESDMDYPKSKRICLDGDVHFNLKIIEKLRDQNEKERFLKDVWTKFRGENQSELELSDVEDKLWLEVRIIIIILAMNL